MEVNAWNSSGQKFADFPTKQSPLCGFGSMESQLCAETLPDQGSGGDTCSTDLSPM